MFIVKYFNDETNEPYGYENSKHKTNNYTIQNQVIYFKPNENFHDS